MEPIQFNAFMSDTRAFINDMLDEYVASLQKGGELPCDTKERLYKYFIGEMKVRTRDDKYPLVMVHNIRTILREMEQIDDIVDYIKKVVDDESLNRIYD